MPPFHRDDSQRYFEQIFVKIVFKTLYQKVIVLQGMCNLINQKRNLKMGRFGTLGRRYDQLNKQMGVPKELHTNIFFMVNNLTLLR